jgi:hypothetical protein
MKRVVLLGDSVFDNGAYVPGQPDVRQQVQELMPSDATVELLARDGATIRDVETQVRRIPGDATHLVVSAGGNDAIQASGILDESAASMADAIEKLGAVAERFAARYSAMLDLLLRRRLPVAICTIYEPPFPDLHRRKIAITALTALNDQITRQAFSRGLTVIDLRIIFNREEDFANPIEPSVHGGAKIARAIMKFVSGAASSAAVIASS